MESSRPSTSTGDVRIVNAYNPNPPDPGLNIDDLLKLVTLNKEVLLCGDFNLTHPRRSGIRCVSPNAKARQLCDGTEAAGMRCMLKPGTITYTRGDPAAVPNTPSPTIDLVFAGRALISRVIGCDVVEVRGFESDHRVLRTVINSQLHREDGTRKLWKNVQTKKFRQDARERLGALGLPPLHSPAALEEFIDAVTEAMQASIAKFVPILMPPSITGPVRKFEESIHVSLKLEEAARRNCTLQNNDDKLYNKWQFLRRQTDKLVKQMSKMSYRDFVESSTEITAGTYGLARVGARWDLAQPRVHMPDLKDPMTHEVCSTPQDKVRCLTNSIWPKTSTGPTAPAQNCPPLDPARMQYSSPQQLDWGEICELIFGIPSGKAEGPDGTAREALKMLHVSRDEKETESERESIIAPILEHIINACFLLSHHPAQFKRSRTVIVEKAGKPTYDTPKNWRPLALLSCMGKVVEKAMSNRLTILSLEHSLVPYNQFGFARRSTTKALELILNRVYRCWNASPRMFATLMTIDMTGAFDHVDREVLLKILVRKGVPDWMVLYISSFLSDRRVALSIPGYTSEEFWVNIGIPQGTPLSPVLFALFSSLILDELNKIWPSSPFFQVMSYVDDTCMVVTSHSYEENCKILTTAFTDLIAATAPSGISLGPSKTHIMHFQNPHKETQGTNSRTANEPEPPRIIPLADLPDVGVEGAKKEEVIKLLGVYLDQSLTWATHVKKITEKMEAKMRTIYRISGSTWGPSLASIRRLYITSVRPIAAYAAPVWFLYRDNERRIRWQISANLVMKLDKAQAVCLRQVAGAYQTTANPVVHQELDVPPLSLFLEKLGQKHRTRNLDTREYARLTTVWATDNMPKTLSAANNIAHPYRILYKVTAAFIDFAARKQLIEINEERATKTDRRGFPLPKLRWRNFLDRQQVRSKVINDKLQEACTRYWQNYLDDREDRRKNQTDPNFRIANHRPLSLSEKWGPASLKYYAELTRAESTMLFHCRTGVVGLKSYLFSIKVRDIVDDLCPCKQGKHTVEHVFIHCPALLAERTRLYLQVDHHDLKKLLTCDSKAAAAWAIRYLSIEQFGWTGRQTPDKIFQNRDGA
ncbi:zinc knuckle [Colletotrichum fioriniae PJ7]|uniref:Zinc knuckle n=1 Tax=Colletotrichum fioriniae PJ7 TaxID=1445577 RepID=A0A010R5B0_9PEZI|nr:zinc knuckle [Colletotrichum fioriniae PJ7]